MDCAMRRPGPELAIALVLCGCPQGRPQDAPCPIVAEDPGEDPGPVAAEPCRPRDDEWATAPPGSPALIPEAIELAPNGRSAQAVVLLGPRSADDHAWRAVFRVGLTDGSIALVSLAPVVRRYHDEVVARAERDPGLDRLLLCAPLPGAGELRLLPRRETDGVPEVPYATRYADALRMRDRSGAETARWPLWLPDASEEGAGCGRWLVLDREGGPPRLQCVNHAQCPFPCLDNTDRDWLHHCTGELPDGLVFCEPRH